MIMTRKHLTSARPTAKRLLRGASLIELMVGLTVGMIVILAVTATVALVNNQRRTTVAGGDAKESAQTALGMIDRSARLAGAGLFYNGQLICTNINIHYNGTTIANAGPLMPARIVDGGNTGSDTLTLTYASALGGSSQSVLVADMPAATPSAVYAVNNSGRLQVNDLALIGVPGNSAIPCTLFQVSQITTPSAGSCNGITTSCVDLAHTGGTTNYTGFTNNPRYGYQSTVAGPAIVSRMGSFVQDTFEVMCNTLVTYNYTQTGRSCTASPLAFTNVTPLVGEVVQVKAQYGVSALPNSDVVTTWTDATGAWTTPAIADIPRIRAVRIAVIARSKEPAPGNVTPACTNAAGVANTGPCTFQDAAAPVVDLSNVAVPAGKTWQNFRYRVYETVIPLRNVLWNY